MFLVEAGSAIGRDLLSTLVRSPAPEELICEAATRLAACARSQTRRLEQSHLPQALYEAHDHPRWDDVAGRCLACTNCTMVCPTCFCHAVEETPDLSQQRTVHAVNVFTARTFVRRSRIGTGCG
jgi:ferredoxin